MLALTREGRCRWPRARARPSAGRAGGTPAGGFGAVEEVVGAPNVTVLGRFKGEVDAYKGKPGFQRPELFRRRARTAGIGPGTRRSPMTPFARGDEIRLTSPHGPLHNGGTCSSGS